MNKIKEVCELLGLEWDEQKGRSEEFKIDEGDFRHYYIDNDGFVKNSEDRKTGWLNTLLSGERKIIKLPWKPKRGETYYFVDFAYDEPDEILWANSDYDNRLFDLGLISKTEEEAQLKLEYYTKFIKDNPYKEEVEE